MSIKYVRTYTRTNKETPFYTSSPEFLAYIQETYVDSGLCTSFRVLNFLDPEELTVEVISEWTTKEGVQMGKADENMLQDSIQCAEYNSQNNIVLVEARVEDRFIRNTVL